MSYPDEIIKIYAANRSVYRYSRELPEKCIVAVFDRSISAADGDAMCRQIMDIFVQSLCLPSAAP